MVRVFKVKFSVRVASLSKGVVERKLCKAFYLFCLIFTSIFKDFSKGQFGKFEEKPCLANKHALSKYLTLRAELCAIDSDRTRSDPYFWSQEFITKLYYISIVMYILEFTSMQVFLVQSISTYLCR